MVDLIKDSAGNVPNRPFVLTVPPGVAGQIDWSRAFTSPTVMEAGVCVNGSLKLTDDETLAVVKFASELLAKRGKQGDPQ